MSLMFEAHVPESVDTVEDTPKNPFTVLDRADIDHIPDLEPMIDGVLDKGTVVMLAADSGVGKSFLALDWAARYATGLDWVGRRVDGTVRVDDEPQDGKVLYVAAEGSRSMKGRLAAWEEHNQTAIPSALFRAIETPVNLSSPGNVDYFIEVLQETGPYGLVIIDTLARCALDLEENSASDMGVVIDELYRIRRAMGVDGTVIAVHHHGKDGSVRGSSALRGGVDQLLKLTRDGDVLELEDEKRKDGAELEPVQLKRMKVGDSLVIVPNIDTDTTVNPLVNVMQHELLHTLPMSKTELVKATDMSEQQVYRCLNRGISSGDIVEVNKGKQNPRYTLSGGL